ncbi:MAG: hypothetical protein HGB10_12105, partial [Coriobacteriia bacterium]|nr:hypothetical protein [Coriobacteriia bacterium]
AHREDVRSKTLTIEADFERVLGPRSLLDRIKEKAALAYALREWWRMKLGRTNYQPGTQVTRFEHRQRRASPLAVASAIPQLAIQSRLPVLDTSAPVMRRSG